MDPNLNKRCSKCGEEKPITEFYKSAEKPDGLKPQCKGCMAKTSAKWNEAHPGYKQKWYANNPDKVRANAARYLANNPESRKRAYQKWKAKNREYARDYGFKREYGINAAEVDRRKVEQNGCCAICGKPAKKLCVDHDHNTGKVRALLCYKCNWALGLFDDSPELMRGAADYIEKHKNL